MEIKKIFFDMDGVLADFDRGVIELCGMQPTLQGDEWRPGMDDPMWAKVRTIDHYYDKLEPLPGAVEMFKTIYEKYGDKCEILTGIPKPKRGVLTAGEDKIKWVRRLLSQDIVVNIVYREEKPNYCTGKDWILIDDLKKNIEEWENNGGTGIRFISAEETLKALKELENR